MLLAPRTGDRLFEVLPPLGRLVQQPKARIGQFSGRLLNALFFLLFKETLDDLYDRENTRVKVGRESEKTNAPASRALGLSPQSWQSKAC
jgi:hypothetical protein